MMRKNKLYTVNPWNRNLFVIGGQTNNVNAKNYGTGSASLGYTPKAPNIGTVNIDTSGATGGGGNSGSNGGGLFGGNTDNLGTAMGIANSAAGAFTGIQTAYSGNRPQYSADAQNGFAQLDTLLTGGKKSKLGTGLVNAGAAVMNRGGMLFHGLGALAAGVLGTAGTIINNGWGYEVENEDAVRENTGRLKNLNFNAVNTDDLVDQFNQAGIRKVGLGEVSNGLFTNEGTRQAEELNRQQNEAYEYALSSFRNAGRNIDRDLYEDYMRNYAAYGGPLDTSNFGGALGLMQQNQYIDAINNRSNAIAKANTMQAPTFSFNKFDDGGFVDGFMQDPIAAAMNYIRQKDAEEAQAEAQAAQEAREQDYADMQTRLMNAETQNQGLQALLEDQGRSIASLQEAQALQASATPQTTNWQEPMMEAAREVVRNNGGAGSLRDYIKKSEKFSPTAYQLEGEAHPTIGYGFYNVYPGTNRKVKKGDVLSQAEADRYLDVAIQERADNLAKKVPNWNKLTSNQQDALIDLAFNAGDNARHFRKGSKLMTALANEDWDAASKQLATTSRNPNFKRGMQNRSNRRRNMFVNGDYSIKAFGGELGTNGTDFTNGLLQVNAGNTHERNPFGGVPLGVDSQGVPNLVEEGETVFNDYVFSKRLKVPNFMLKDLGLGGAMQKGKRHRMSFADVSKKLAEESEMRPNDPISMNGLNASLSKLMEIQEAERMKQQAKMQNEEMEMMPEMGLMAACGGKLNRYDYGGNLFKTGGKKGRTYTRSANEKSALSKIVEAIGLGKIANSKQLQNVLDELGLDKASIRRMQSDLTDLGILPRGGDDGQQLGIAPFADRGVMRGIATAARRDLAASRLAARGQMPNAARNFRGATNATNTGRNYVQEANNVVNNRNSRIGQRWAENARNASRPAMGEASKAAAPDAYAGLEGTVIPYEGRLNGWGWPIGVAATLGTAGVGSYLYDEKTSGSGSPYLPQPAKSTSGKKNSWYIPGHKNVGTFKTEKEAQDYYNKNIRGKQAQAAPTSSSTPSTAASNTGSTRSAARRNAAPATNRAAQNTTQGNIPPQTDFGAYRQNRANNPFNDVATQNQTIADAKWMADQLGMPLEVEGAAPGVNTNPTNRNWNLGNYDWLSGDFNPSNTTGFIPYNRNMSADDIAREEGSDRYKAWTDYVLSNWDNQDVQSYLRELDTRAGGNHLFDANGNLRDDARDYFQYARGVGDGSNHAWGYYHLTPTWAEEAAANGARPITEADYTLTEDELNAAGDRIDEQSRAWTGSGNPVADAVNAAAGQRTTVQGPPTYKTWMRYAPAVGAGIFALTDALGITNKHDYTYADKLEAAANRAGYAPNIQAPYIGDYMRYTPFDRLFYSNQLQANARATDRALMNNSGANRGTAAANLLANAYNTNNNLGNLYRQGDEYNRAQYERTKEFNRRTNMFNAQMGLEADMANARFTQQASQMGLHGLAQAANMRENIDARTDATRSANLSNLFTSLGNIGRENMAFNMINSTNAARNGYWIDNKGVVHYVGRGDGLV